MTTDTDSTAPVLGVHGLGLGIGLKGLRKTWENPPFFFFRCAHFSILDSLAIALLNITNRLSIPPYPPSLTLLRRLLILSSFILLAMTLG
jgi:hypothetical protein